jgi:thiol-disulfide isomerase/thioredoxin
MRTARFVGFTTIGVLLACGGTQGAPEPRTELGPSATDSAFSADSATLAAILARDAADRQASLALRASDKFAPYTGSIGTTASAYSGDQTPTRASPVARAPGVHRLTAAEVAEHLRRRKGQVTVAILYGTRCPRTRAMFPTFVALAARYREQPVHIAAFALDNYPQDVPGFLARYAAPFDSLSIRDGKVGELSGALAPLGFFGGPGAVDPAVGVTISMPYVAVLGRDGYVRAAWHAATNVAAIDQAVRTELAR